ncbi:MAG: AIR synthase related protein [Candidatus Heimdallarchaeota archaeon]
MEEGKLPLELLEQLLKQQKGSFDGLIQGPKVGSDVAVVDFKKAITRVLAFYNSKAEVYFVSKTDPITFPTPDPGRYAVIVNANDVVTSGALPYGFSATIIVPDGSSKDLIFNIQKSIYEECHKNNIAVLGGHTEISSSVNTPIVSGSMIGFVPEDYYVPREINEGDVMLCVGWCAREGVGIIASEGYKKLQKHFPNEVLDTMKNFGKDISIVDIALKINKQFKPSLMHDATEGGILGAAYETISPENFGLALNSKNFPVTSYTCELCKILDVNPLRLISSGTLLVILDAKKAKAITKLNSSIIPIKIIGEITAKKQGITLDGSIIPPPSPDAVIAALTALEKL